MAAKSSAAATATAAAAPPLATTTLKDLAFEKKNTNLLHIPSQPIQDNSKKYRIAKRPIPRTPVASPYAGSQVPKIVYISSKTPFMSAVKRIQKFLRLAERRAMMPLIGKRRHHHQQRDGIKGGAGGLLEKCQRKLREDKVLVKATGRAIEKALSVGRWFEEGKGQAGGEEYEVCVRTGSVCVVDDIVEEDVLDDVDTEAEAEEKDGEADGEGEDSIDPDITMSMTTTTNNSTANTQQDSKPETKEEKEGEESKSQRRRRRKRERIREQRLKAFIDEDGETPESRTRWVNMVEIAINIK